jgi:hypothetical protein
LFQIKTPLFTIALIAYVGTAFAQSPTDNSPYTRFGLGDLYNNRPVATIAQGGTAVTWANSCGANFANPAGLGSLDLTSYEIGIYGRYSQYSSAANSSTGATGGINNLSLSFPIFNPLNQLGLVKKRSWKWGMGFGLNPYSGIDYSIVQKDTISNFGPATRAYTGRGGLYQLQWANGIRIKNFQAGLSLGYLFGKSQYYRAIQFTSLSYAAGDVFTDDILYNGFSVRPGLQYELTLTQKRTDETDDDFRRRDKLHLIFGATANITPSMTAANTYNYSRRQNGLSEVVEEAENDKKTVVMPTTFTGGLRMTQDNNWSIAAEYETSNWSAYKNPLQNTQSFNDIWALRVGGEWTPNYKSFGNYWNRVSYRAGYIMGTDPRVILSKQITNSAVTFGMGFPVRLPRGLPSFVNVGVEVGKQGAVDLIQQNYSKLTLGFSLNDNTWFFHRKFD